MERPPAGKISRGDEGLGTPTPEMVEERANAIARDDGRKEPNDLDREQAKAELTGADIAPEEDAEKQQPGQAWGMPPVSSGEQAPVVGPEDEANIGELLVQEGVEEADRDRRNASGRENPPENNP